MEAPAGYGKTKTSIQESIRYVVSGQGEPMEVYLADSL